MLTSVCAALQYCGVIFRLAPEFRGLRFKIAGGALRSALLTVPLRFLSAPGASELNPTSQPIKTDFSLHNSDGNNVPLGAFKDRIVHAHFFAMRRRSALDRDGHGSDVITEHVSGSDTAIAHQLFFAAASLTIAAATLCPGCDLDGAEIAAIVKEPPLSVADARQSRDARSTNDAPAERDCTRPSRLALPATCVTRQESASQHPGRRHAGSRMHRSADRDRRPRIRQSNGTRIELARAQRRTLHFQSRETTVRKSPRQALAVLAPPVFDDSPATASVS